MNTETKSQMKDETTLLTNKNLLKPEHGNSSADECSTNKKKTKKRERSPGKTFKSTFFIISFN